MAGAVLQMLRKLERLWSRDIPDRPLPENSVEYWVGTSLGVAGVPLLVGAGQLEEIIEMPAVTPIPGTRDWVLGVASHRGGLLPIISGDILFRQAPYQGRRDYCMVVRRPGFYFGITLSSVERDLKLPVQSRLANPDIDPDLQPYCSGGFEHEGKVLGILYLDRLTTAEELADACDPKLKKAEESTDE